MSFVVLLHSQLENLPNVRKNVSIWIIRLGLFKVKSSRNYIPWWHLFSNSNFGNSTRNKTQNQSAFYFRRFSKVSFSNHWMVNKSLPQPANRWLKIKTSQKKMESHFYNSLISLGESHCKLDKNLINFRLL